MKRFFLILILSLFIFSACVPDDEQMPTATPVEQVSADVKQEAVETPLPEPTDTPQPEVENIEEQVFEQTATETPTLTATVNPFADASIISYWYINDSTMMITIKVPGGVPAGVFTTMVEKIEYSCEVLPDYPDRLYCNGPALPEDEKVVVSVFVGNTRMFEGSFTVPVFGLPSIEEEDGEEESSGASLPDLPVPPPPPPPWED